MNHERGLARAFQRFRKLHKDTVHVLHHIQVGEPDHVVSAFVQVFRSRRVVRVVNIMRVAVDLYDEPGLVRSKIGDVMPTTFCLRNFTPSKRCARTCSQMRVSGSVIWPRMAFA